MRQISLDPPPIRHAALTEANHLRRSDNGNENTRIHCTQPRKRSTMSAEQRVKLSAAESISPQRPALGGTPS
jgi:hypothetical protein